MKQIFIFLTIISLVSSENKLIKTDKYLTKRLEGKNNVPLMDLTMEGLALATPFIEFGFAGFDQFGKDKLQPSLAAILGVQLPVAIGKYGLKRDRPVRKYNPRLWNSRFTPSFPSGHATTTAAWATSIALASPRNTSLMIGYTLISGYSQVYVGNHYVSDVIAGWFLGWVTGRYFYTLYNTNQNHPMGTPLLKISIPL
ncbi:MAG: phosphatase PAP2 family protein [Candidatus Marinimicrobia bacterium]|nr:phosphatase PAP2 family protein [Candidatus Neomarinimicrobiota bacterium]